MIDIKTAIENIKALVTSKGYIYALCMILCEDFHVILEELHEVNNWERLSNQEASLLLGFLIQEQIDFSVPDTPEDLIQLKQQTYVLLKDLHESFHAPFIEKLNQSLMQKQKMEDFRFEQKDFFGKGDMLTEPIFYSGTGAYDFQYLEFLDKKYKYDKKWLSDNKAFDFAEAKNIVSRIKDVLQKKTSKVQFYSLKEKLPSMIEDMKKKNPKEDWEKHAKEILPMMEMHQYVNLFFENIQTKDNSNSDSIRNGAWESFYKSLIELFVIDKSDFNTDLNIEVFLNEFSITPKKGLNSQFVTIGSYNLVNSHPIIKLDDQRYFVPTTFLLFEAIYETPFYWMVDSEEYRDRAGENRGKVGEEIAYELLSKVFGIDRTYKSVKVTTKKGHDDTDIDVLCVLGSKALCVQVKSKKLTLISRNGDDEQLQKDFKGAVQDAYEQGLIVRQKILGKESVFTDTDGKNIKLSEEIDEVYLMGITTENYPSLAFQALIMLNKKDSDPFPIISTIFDLELLVHYLYDPYDFLYYIRQRTSLMDYFIANEEIVYLGYHLMRKLWRTPDVSMVTIDSSYGGLIDRNYYPFKAGIKVSDEGDAIKNRWKSEAFNYLCDELKKSNQAKITDIIFHLYDESGYARKTLVDLIKRTKQRTLSDGRSHDFSIPPDDSHSPHVGITYISLDSDNRDALLRRLWTLCQARKYRSKGDVWIGFGSLKNSHNIIDAVIFINENWQHNDELEKFSESFFKGSKPG